VVFLFGVGDGKLFPVRKLTISGDKLRLLHEDPVQTESLIEH